MLRRATLICFLSFLARARRSERAPRADCDDGAGVTSGGRSYGVILIGGVVIDPAGALPLIRAAVLRPRPL